MPPTMWLLLSKGRIVHPIRSARDLGAYSSHDQQGPTGWGEVRANGLPVRDRRLGDGCSRRLPVTIDAGALAEPLHSTIARHARTGR